MPTMTKQARIKAVLAGEPTDRIPISFWRHFPDCDLDPLALAKALVDFHRRYDLDFIKLMPNGVYGVEDWGCEIAYQGGSNGARTCVRHAVQTLEDWDRLRPLVPTAKALARELTCLQAVCANRGDDAPVLQTIFSPFTVARKVAGPELVQETMTRDPKRLERALEVISATVVAFLDACVDAGAAGVFFASQTASAEVMSWEDHQRFVAPYDQRVLAAANQKGAMVLFHLHGERPYVGELAKTYPVHALNWHDRRTPPSLAQAKSQVRQCLVGGLDERGTLVTGSPEAIRNQVRDAVAQCGGRGLVVGPGCVLDLKVPGANLVVAREAIEGLRVG